MSRPQQITYRDAARVAQLCGELSGYSPMTPQWRQHLVEGVLRLVPGKFASFAEMIDFRPGRRPRIIAAHGAGWIDQAGQRDWADFAARGDFERENPCVALMMRCLKRSSTRRRVDQVDDGTWYRSPMMADHLKVAGLDDNIDSMYRIDESSILDLTVMRDGEDRRRFSVRERQLLHLLQLSLAPIFETYRRAFRLRKSLSPRLQQTLERLLAGESEKQIARDLHLSRHTVHGYIKAIYQQLNVSSRVELIAKCRFGG